MTASDPRRRHQTLTTADERETLLSMLAFQRDTLRWKCSGLTREQQAQTHPPSGLSLGGLLKHLTLVEVVWTQQVFAGRPPPDWATGPSRDMEWTLHLDPDESVDDWLPRLDAVAEQTGDLVGEATSLDLLALAPPHGDCSLRWIMLHLVQEYARHLGHADLIREAVDGSTGV